MEQIFTDENHSCEIDFTKANWATDQLNDIFHTAKLSLLSDVDFVAETDEELLLIEYKNANLAGRLPFKLQKDVAGMEKMIDSLEVLSVEEWNEKYGRFPLRLLGEV